MKPRVNLPGHTIDHIWEDIIAVAETNSLHNYHASMTLDGHAIDLDIVSSPGGGAEGGYSYTTLTSELPAVDNFHFIIYPEDIITKIGKFFGMQDVTLGYPELDKYAIIKTNDTPRLKAIFDKENIRVDLLSFSGYELKLDDHGKKPGAHAEFTIQRALTDPNELRIFLEVFHHVLVSV